MAAHAFPPQAFHVVVKTETARVVVVPHGELDLATVGLLDTEIQELRAKRCAAIVLDLRQLAFMDSMGLRLLLRCDTEARSDGISFAIIEGDGPPRRLLDVTRLGDRFERVDA